MKFAIAAAAAAALALTSAASAAAKQAPIPGAPGQWATDGANFITTGERERLNAQLQSYEAQTGHQVLVWIGRTTGETPLEEWTANAFAKWKVGRKGLDDGAVLFIFADDRKVRIEVGYGLESVLTDARSSEIIRNEIVPRIRAGDADGAVQAGVDAMLAGIGGAGQAAPPPENEPSPAAIIAGFLILMLLALLIMRSPAFAGWMLYTMASGGGGFGRGGFGGGSGGGLAGGFSGGGGMSGGGGASGSW